MRYVQKLIVCCLLFVAGAEAQTTFPVNGVFDHNHNYYAFTNAKIWIDYQTTIASGTLLIKDGMIVQCGEKVQIPQGAVVMDMKGRSIYPSFIDPYSTYGMPEIKRVRGGPGPQMENAIKGPYNWNQAIRPETDAVKLFNADRPSAEELRKLGFGSVMSFNRDGIVRGTGVFVTLGEEKENLTVLNDKVAALYSFEKGTSTQDYPSSLMGSIALIRQTYYDAQWYAENKEKTEYNISLDVFNKLQGLPQVFEIRDKLSALRADKIGDEFKIQYIIKGCGNEYQRMEEIKSTNAKFILPLNFPAAFDVEDPYDAMMVSLEDMKHWEMAPLNPSAFEQNFIPFAFTTSDLKDKKDFWKNLRKAIAYGLSEKQALKSLTLTPAELLGMQGKVGALKPGMVANFIITSGNVFDEKNIIYQNWVQGEPYVIYPFDMIDVRGTFTLTTASANTVTLKVSGEPDKLKALVGKGDTAKINASITLNNQLVTITYDLNDDNGIVRLSGTVSDDGSKMKGKGQDGQGNWITWSAVRKAPAEIKPEKKDSLGKDHPTLEDVMYPFCAYGQSKKDSSFFQKFMNRWNAVLIKNVTVWTNESDGILLNKDVLITDGKIVRIGDNLEVPKTVKALRIDGTGKYLTAGIIDEHSHIAISDGVNEGTQSSSSEVRIGDVINSEDINIYRQLSGGVTACQLLHGSANPIGGQSGLIKLKWGAAPEEMKISGADGFIKFALGENVKQSNWGDFNTVRFPQSRMGVEQVYFDEFIRAKEYQAKWNAYQGLSPKDKLKTMAPRRDLELDAISEILNKKRFITCHSYVQSEINMLMHVGDSMGFQVNTFTHILEGYKVADKMKARNIFASTFSDWWAYKMEVKDAIPFNAAIMYSLGLTVCINSDDAEMGRRLNQEAGKTVKYGNVPEQDAFKMVSLNPSMALHLDKRMGSIKVGKDGDVVLWTDNPLSIYARVDKTIIEGVVYYDAEKDKQLREEIRKERSRLIQKMLAEKSGGAPTQKPSMKKPKEYHCEDLENYGAYTDEENLIQDSEQH
jgi:imidazolonepropionase-like amidohydrolase